MILIHFTKENYADLVIKVEEIHGIHNFEKDYLIYKLFNEMVNNIVMKKYQNIGHQL